MNGEQGRSQGLVLYIVLRLSIGASSFGKGRHSLRDWVAYAGLDVALVLALRGRAAWRATPLGRAALLIPRV